MKITNALNSHFDKFIRPNVRIGQHSWHAFKACGCTGMALAILLALTLATHSGLPKLMMVGLILLSILTFIGVILVTKIITGEEQMIYYHHEISVMVVAALLLHLLHQPTLPYFDVIILGVGMFLACGRVGCLMVGCCHGLPYHWGVAYQSVHAAAGLSPHFVGVRLFPIQALESLWVFGTVIVGVVYVMTGQTPGEALAWYVVMYGLGRFFFEFMRGDTERRYYLGFSEAQWISLLLMCAVVWAELEGTLTFYLWHLGATAVLEITMIAVAIRRTIQGTSKYLLLHPHHIQEVAEAVQLASNLAVEGCYVCKQGIAPVNIHMGCTSLGIQISASKIKRAIGYTYHYAISYKGGIFPEAVAKSLAKFILLMKYPNNKNEFLRGNGSVFHLLVHPTETEGYSQLKNRKR